MSQPRVLAIVLAGGEGKRLLPLTADRAKPAVPFGGDYRLIDFVLSNMANGGYLRMVVLTQYKSHSLDRHVTTTWRLTSLLSNYVTPVPAQQRLGPYWFAGSSDAIFQSLNLIYDDEPDYVIVFGADHIYRMDPRQMVAQHIDSGAGVTVAGIRQPISLADQFGVIEAGPDGRQVAAFREKPSDPIGLADNPQEIYASMGNYVFTTDTLIEAVTADARDEDSRHDLGGNIIPMMVKARAAQVYDFKDNVVPGSNERGRGYWRDVGTIDSFYEAHMDLLSAEPLFDLHNAQWPVFTSRTQAPGAKFVSGGTAADSIVNAGCLLSGGRVERSVLSPSVTVLDGAQVEGSVLMQNVTIGKGAKVRNAILDKNVQVPAGARIGYDSAADREHYTVSAAGVTVLGKDQPVAP